MLMETNGCVEGFSNIFMTRKDTSLALKMYTGVSFFLQFDGIGNTANSHPKAGNLFDVKLQAIINLHEARVEVVPVTDIINGINNMHVGHVSPDAVFHLRPVLMFFALSSGSTHVYDESSQGFTPCEEVV
ncbi:MAG: hypothetical protein ABR990_03540 [Terracidiphilus sp.]